MCARTKTPRFQARARGVKYIRACQLAVAERVASVSRADGVGIENPWAMSYTVGSVARRNARGGGGAVFVGAAGEFARPDCSQTHYHRETRHGEMKKERERERDGGWSERKRGRETSERLRYLR